MRFRFWNTGAAEGAHHMAIDRVLWQRIEKGLSEPMIRVYTWQPHCVTLGHSQEVGREIDLAALASRGWTWARRATGGRAVLHTREFTYSVLAPVHAAPWCAQRDLSYAAIGKALLQLLARQGVRAELARGEVPVVGGEHPDRPIVRDSKSGPTRACFASTSRLEVTWQGRKLVGSAQRRGRHAFLQHGSMPLSEDYLELAEVLPLNAASRQSFRSEMQSHALCLAEAMPPGHAGLVFEDLAADAKAVFAEALQVECTESGLTDAEWQDIEQAMQVQVAEPEVVLR